MFLLDSMGGKLSSGGPLSVKAREFVLQSLTCARVSRIKSKKSNIQRNTCFFFLFQFQDLDFSIRLLCLDVVSLISSPFKRVRQPDHIAEGKARSQHLEHALLFSTSVWERPRSLLTLKSCETGPTVFSPVSG